MALFQELCKIIKQIRGTENMFEYKTTTANQLFLLYCLSGKLYFTDKIRWQLKWLWLTIHVSTLSVEYLISLMYVYSDMEKTMWTNLNVINYAMAYTLMGVWIPLGSYLYRKRIESLITNVDVLLTHKSRNLRNHPGIDVKNVLILNLTIYAIGATLYMSICIFDVLFFFTGDKLRNCIYYLFPFPHIESNDSVAFFLVSNSAFSAVFGFFLFQWMAVVGLILVWSVICQSELLFICDQCNTCSVTLGKQADTYHEISTQWNETLRKTMLRNVQAYNEVNKLINSLRGFIEFLCSFAIPVSFFGEVSQFYTIVSTDMPYSVKLKGVSYCVGLISTIYPLFWIGEMLENSVSAVSLAVYSTPWYWSVSMRKEIYIFLSQTQKTRNLSIMTMYPLLCKSFLRYLHSILSAVNVLRKITHK